MDNYLTQKIALHEEVEEKQISRKELMQRAGYSEASIKSNNPELTQLYTIKVEELINKTGFIMREFVEAIEKDVQAGMVDRLPLQAKVKTLSLITSIFKGLSPSFKSKTTTKEADGTIKNVWTKLN